MSPLRFQLASFAVPWLDWNPLNVELINTGSELMLGEVLNTHAQWLCRELAGLGFVVGRQTAVSDQARAITEALRDALGRANLVIITGGLGPTTDDRTRDCAADLLGLHLEESPEVLTQLQQFFAIRNRSMPERARLQALVPPGALVLPNQNGTAPGLAITVPAGRIHPTSPTALLLMLPGPGRELRPMFTNQVVPLLRSSFPSMPRFCRVLRTVGLPESLVEEKLDEPLKTLTERGLDLGYCAKPLQVDIRLAADGPNAEPLVREAELIARRQLGPSIFGIGGESLAAVVLNLLRQAGQTFALAESCTGGYIANSVTNVPGASTCFLAGYVTYSNQAKQQSLGVNPDTLERFGAVSEQTAKEMAEGARSRSGASFALAVTGIAGPSGGTAEKPVGTVFIALADSNETTVVQKANATDRETFKELTATQSLDLLRRRLA